MIANLDTTARICDELVAPARVRQAIGSWRWQWIWSTAGATRTW